MDEFNAETCPLDGVNLVEASAGTGKTYNIQLLVLRLVLKGVPLRKILVVTFTVFATQELMTRLHSILMSAGRAFDLYQKDKDSIKAPEFDQVRNIVKEEGKTPEGCRKCGELIAAALMDFDQAAVMTIHGFCQRMLTDNAFASKMSFGVELKENIAEIRHRIAMDFMRMICCSTEYPVLCSKLDAKVTADWLLDRLDPALNNAENGATICWGAPSDAPWRDQLGDLNKKAGKVAQAAEQAENESEQAAQAAEQAKNEAETAKESKNATEVKAAKKAAKDAKAAAQAAEKAAKKAQKEAAQAAKKAETAAKAAAVKLADGLGPCFLAFYRERLAKIKAEENFFTFDDLIRVMAEIVADEENGKELREAIRENYQYAFVDEFQDTDPLQYEIFSRIFGRGENGEADEDRGFFMIGDPKQAIYSFRGGDIFAYRKACDEVPPERRYTLTRNFRSSEKYIAAMKKFFDDERFVEMLSVPPIEFGGNEKLTLCRNGNPVEKEELLQFDGVANAGLIKEATIDKILELLSVRYDSEDKDKKNPLPVYTLEDPDKNSPRAVSASDIAVLFPTTGVGAEIESMLNKAGLDTVWMSDSDIFQKPEAKALYDLLKMLHEGCLFPQIRAVLSGDIFRCTATELCRLQKNDVFTEEQRKKFDGKAEAAQKYFLGLRKVWEEQGFYAMFRKLMFAPNSEGIFPSKVDGTSRQWLVDIRDEATGRFETDGTLAQHLVHCDFIEGRYELGRLRQLGELLHQAEQARQLTPGRLLNFLLAKIERDRSGDDDDTAALIQRSTDLDAVRLLTLHKSKGLQFPIVIIPSFVSHINNKKPARLFHGGAHNIEARPMGADDADTGEQAKEHTRCIDMTGWAGGDRNDKNKENCNIERLDEKTRLLYVGLTRAKYFCYLSFFVGDRSCDAAFRDKLPWQDFQASKEVGADLEIRPPAICGEGSEVRDFEGAPVRDWDPVSFSGFTNFLHGGKNASPAAGALSQQDIYGGGTDELSVDDGPETPTSGGVGGPLPGDEDQEYIFKFGSGSEMGTVWHEIFEKMDFAPSGLSDDGVFRDSECEAVLNAIEKRSLYNFIRRCKGEDEEESRKRDVAFARMLKGILYNPMGAEVGAEGFRLRDIPKERRAAELKFMFVLKENVTLSGIRQCLERHGIDTGTWADSAVAGYCDRAMTGFIDLLCQSGSGKYWIIDWKSNRLNSDLTEFDRSGLQAEIDKNLYSLQYLIYTVALWHFLKARRNIDLTEDNYEKYFGGILYLFIRGIAAPLGSMTKEQKQACMKRGVYFELPPFPLIKELKEMLEIRPFVPSAAADRTRNAAAEAEK